MTPMRWLLVMVTLVACAVPGCGCSADAVETGPEGTMDRPPRAQLTVQDQPRTVHAPEFPEGLPWFNVAEPLSMEGLRGKIVLLDFWTYCCINCMHVLPDLHRLETEFANELVVIGVHSAKFRDEGLTENIRQAIERYDIRHPVVNDHGMRIWRSFGVRAWPTLVLVDWNGRLAAQVSGEGQYDELRTAITDLIAEAGDALNTTPIELSLEREQTASGVLRYPGKVLADEDGERLFIADTGHHRVVEVSMPDGAVTRVFGDGMAGLQDGEAASARFYEPQGMALLAGRLYVADRANHALRRIDLQTGNVETVLGDGNQASWRADPAHEPRRLASPWALACHDDGWLYIAMAGPHQLWRYLPAEDTLEIFAGNRRENIVDGPRLDAQLAQPSGLVLHDDRLYFLDSETSSLRFVELSGEERVRTIVGEGLFEFGDRDGTGDEVRLQHPLGIARIGGTLYIADTYNDKIKRVNPETRTVMTLSGDGRGGYRDGRALEARFDEPSGMTVYAGSLVVADTNNHAIRLVDPETGQARTLTLQSLDTLVDSMDEDAGRRQVTHQTVMATNRDVTVTVRLVAPTDHHLNAEAPSSLSARLRPDDGEVEVLEDFNAEGVAHVRVRFEGDQAFLLLSVDAYYCRDGAEGLCLWDGVRVEVPIALAPQPTDEPMTTSISVTLRG